MMEIGEYFYLMSDGRPFRATYQGETSRSWLVGEYKWKPMKFSKKEYKIVTKDIFKNWWWAENNARDISIKVRDLGNCGDSAKLRQIAEIVGYKEEVKP